MICSNRFRLVVKFICLCTFLVSCVGPEIKVPPSREIAGPVHVEEDVDTDCSYFYFLSGKSAELERNYDEAIEFYEKAIVCDESAEYVIRKLVVLLAQVGEKKLALTWINKIIARHPNEISPKLLLGNLYAAIGEYKQSRKVYLKILEQDSQNSQALLMLASLAIKEAEYNKAMEILERLVKIEPDSLVAYRYLAKIYRQLHYDSKALAAYQRALALKWQNSLAMEAASLYQADEKFEGAVSLYQKVIKDDYINEVAAARLALLYVKMGEVDKALDLLQELRKSSLDPKDVDLAMGRVLLGQKRFDEAVTLYLKMLKLYPDFEIVKSVLALTYYEKGEKDKAKELLVKVSKDAEGYRDVLVLLLNIMRDTGEYEAAIELLEERIKEQVDTKDFSLPIILADLYEAKGDREKALSLYEQAIIDFPDESQLYLKYGMFLDEAGRPAEAMVQIEEVLKFEPENPFALNYLGYTWAEQGINLEIALKYIKKALLLKPDDGFIIDSLGWVYFMRGDFAKAVTELKKASIVEPDDPTIMEHYGDALKQHDQAVDALIYYKRSFKLYKKEKDLVRIKAKIKAVDQLNNRTDE